MRAPSFPPPQPLLFDEQQLSGTRPGRSALSPPTPSPAAGGERTAHHPGLLLWSALEPSLGPVSTTPRLALHAVSGSSGLWGLRRKNSLVVCSHQPGLVRPPCSGDLGVPSPEASESICIVISAWLGVLSSGRRGPLAAGGGRLREQTSWRIWVVGRL